MKTNPRRFAVLLAWSALATLFAVAIPGHAEEDPTFSLQTYAHPFAKGLSRGLESHEFIVTAPRVTFKSTKAAVPAKASLRGNAGPVEDQGFCGSCWDFALTTTLRGTLMAAGGHDPGRLSFNYLLNCTTQKYDCNGGDFDAAQSLIAPKGAPVYGSDGTYTGKRGTCQPMSVAASAASYRFLGTDLGQNASAPTPSFRDIAYAIGVLHRPVAVDIYVNSNWEHYSSGTFNACTQAAPSDVNHMVVIEGYNCESAVDSSGHCNFDGNGNLPAGVGTWLIRNSWGIGWGDGGYVTMKATDSQGKLCNAVASDALYYELPGKLTSELVE